MYLFYAPGQITTFGEEKLGRLPDGGGERVVYADRCAVDEEELAVRGVTFRKIPCDLQGLISLFGKCGAR